MLRGLKVLSVATTILMYIMLLMGALVTNTGSGQGCGQNWPLCKGTFMPDWDYAATIEFSHRSVAGLGGFLTLVLAVWVWRALREQEAIRWLAAGSLGLVVLQGGLGAAAVLWPQPKAVLALHFGISLLCFAGVLLVTVLLFRLPTKEERPPAEVPTLLRRFIWWVAIFSYIVMYLGAFVRHLHASPACQGWPLCNGQLVPPLYGDVGANFAHRVAAALGVVLVVRLALLVRRMAPERADLRRAADLTLLLILLQVAGGAVMALGYLNLLWQMVHTATVTLYGGTLAYLCLGSLPGGGLGAGVQSGAPPRPAAPAAVQ